MHDCELKIKIRFLGFSQIVRAVIYLHLQYYTIRAYLRSELNLEIMRNQHETEIDFLSKMTPFPWIRVQSFNSKLKFARLMWHPYIRTRNSTFGFPGFLSIYVRFYRPFFKIHLRKIMTEQITQRFEFSMTKWTILDGWAVMRSDQPMRFSTIFKNILDCETQIYGIKSITNRIWFEIALIYWKPLFDCNWIL